MAILSCCCGKSLKRGSFYSAIFTLAFYTILLIAVAFNISTATTNTALLLSSVSILILSAGCVLSSIFLIVGLCMDNRLMLLPWILFISITAFHNLVVSLYFVINETDASKNGSNLGDSQTYPEQKNVQSENITASGDDEPIPLVVDLGLVILLLVDFLFCGLHLYCLLCVISQFQEYVAGRGRAGPYFNAVPQPIVRLQHSQSNIKPTSVILGKTCENGITSGNANLLHPPKPHVYLPALRGAVELSSISEEPSSHDPGAKISTDDTSLDDDSHTSSSFGPKKLFALPEKRIAGKTKSLYSKQQNEEVRKKKLAREIVSSNEGRSTEAVIQPESINSQVTMESAHLLEGYKDRPIHCSEMSFVLSMENSIVEEDSSVTDSQQWI